MLLKRADVFIRIIKSSGIIEVDTNEANYAVVRKILLSLKEEFGLPLSLTSEEAGKLVSSLRANGNSSYTVALIDEGTILARTSNEFLIPAWRMLGETAPIGKYRELAEEVATYIRSFGLEVNVQ